MPLIFQIPGLEKAAPLWRNALEDWVSNHGAVVTETTITFPDGYNPLSFIRGRTAAAAARQMAARVGSPPPSAPALVRAKAPPPPRIFSPEEMDLAAGRAAICRACDQVRSVKPPEYFVAGKKFVSCIVGCNRCGCGGLDLLGKGNCPLGKW
jgi:hypothetical protein